ncbi:5175_t:CDS:2 [Cetraspora pellucida]|uniref:5175_t:CDS:1 n=1 Tax=Cetraspora pellucida TaxID=1433469 RepID=A0A9N9NWU1_9GLOM|nr:5175_t:CDS:2 [Cetraspora pellucida]
MPSHIDTIVKITQVRQSFKEELKLMVVWAIGVYPVGSEDREMEMVLFVPIDDEERDPNTQSVFEKNEFYSVGGKVVSESYNGNLRLKMTVTSLTHLTIKRDLGSNRCPLKVSLVGVVQDTVKEVNDENAIFGVLVKDYVSQDCSFMVKVVFPYHNSRFKHFKNSIRPNESVLFIIGQMEIIQGDLYAYAADISYVNINFMAKRKISSSDSSQTTTELHRSVRSKLLTAHQAASENLPKTSVTEKSDKGKEVIGSTTVVYSLKCIKVEDESDDLYYNEDEHTTVYDKKEVDNNDICEKNIICENKRSMRSNKGKGTRK